MTARARQKGMTLPEVLIALLVFAAIATASVYALRLGVDSRDQLARVDAELKTFQIARTLIKEDMAQVTMRRVRNQFGDMEETVFRGNLESFGARREDDERLLAAFVRGGQINPDAAAPRSALQYVEYVYRNGALIRRSRAYLDEAEDADVIERVLFDGLLDAKAEFLLGEQRGELEWADIWPVGAGSAPPRAVAITLERENRPPLRQLFWIGSVGGAGA
ncbi:type II secretion system minor pseudopilin GspJ [Hyphococcus luteus]|uniref:Type II secretion system protein J n=1 Tax=Hyphococcus luteus TaxID=2058213 RepID=A0A2S7K2S1_9PROT|nr:type II secretion system minor pseudopilin GspJ [Marinicaulis flavus]PQA86802.1 type II secretion system protein GspJ [Marinicaulis flavus]